MRVWLGTSAGLLMVLGLAATSRAQSADSTSHSPPTAAPEEPGPDRFDAQRDPFAVETADGLGLVGGQRKVFFDNVQAVVHDALIINPAGGRAVIDSSVAVVARETGKKIKFIRQARLLFGEMYARRKGDANRIQATEDELWRSPRNVSGLIELYRRNPNAQDFEIERAMAPAFAIPH
jgi:hypothetical protein